MKARQPLNLPQVELTRLLIKFITDNNKGLQLEFDMLMMQPCIDSANKLIQELNSWGDFPFVCDCENEHDEKCHLANAEPYDIVEKHELEWQAILSSINTLPDGFPFADLLNQHRNLPYNVFKGLLSKAIEEKIVSRKEDELFYKAA